MKAKILITICFALSFCVEVYAEGEQEVKRGLFPFMAFIYYPDETVVDGTGARFLRGAVLIRPDWLITSAVGPSILTDGPNGFPRKTLIARAGAITIDANFTLNEDEDEQEREIIQIVRPYNHSATQWWHTDISLMKTLFPFNLTSAVYNTVLNYRTEFIEKNCILLVYAKKYGNWTEERNLMQMTVELLPGSIDTCGHHFLHETMACATDSDENKNGVYDPNFCQGNSGGPMICESEVMGLQTYIDNNCKPPHLYQILSAWENFITCGTEDKCGEGQCSKICDVANKDSTSSINVTETTTEMKTTTINPTTLTTTTASDMEEIAVTRTNKPIESDEKQEPIITQQYQPTIDQIRSDEMTSEQVTSEQVTLEQITLEQITLKQVTLEQSTTELTTLEQITSEQTTSEKIVLQSVVEDRRTTTERQYLVSASVAEEFAETKTWPKVRKPLISDEEGVNRRTKVEAQLHHRNGGHTIVINHISFFGYIILAYWI